MEFKGKYMKIKNEELEHLKNSVKKDVELALNLYDEERFVCRMITQLVWDDSYENIVYVYMLVHVRPKLSENNSTSSIEEDSEKSEGGDSGVWIPYDPDDNGPNIPLTMFHLDLITTMKVAKNELKQYLIQSNTPDVYMNYLFND